jgi:hypothetical protein
MATTKTAKKTTTAPKKRTPVKVSKTVSVKSTPAKSSASSSSISDLQKKVLWVQPLINAWKIFKDTSKANGLEEILQVTEGAYRELIQNADIMMQLMDSAVQTANKRLVKPKETSAQLIAESPIEQTLTKGTNQ